MEEISPLPQWLEPLLEAKFYGQCPKHASRLCNFFCHNCEPSTFCELCHNEHRERDHIVFQVFKASHFPGVKDYQIGRYYDVRDIQVYQINRKRIVYLNPRRQRNNGLQHRNPEGSHCKQCGFVLLQAKYDFCSVRCKVHFGANSSASDLHEDARASTTVDEDESTAVSTFMQEFFISYRQKMRKGIPRRSPLF